MGVQVRVMTTFDRANSAVTADSYRGFGQWTILEVQEVTSSVSTVDFDVSGYTEFDDLRWDVFNMTNTTNATNFNMYESTDGGSSYASSYNNMVFRSNHVSGVTSAMTRGYSSTRGSIEIATSLGNFSYCRCSGYVEAYNWQSTSLRHLFRSYMIGWMNASQPGGFFHTSGINPSAAATDYKFQMTSGNIDGGQFILQGRKHPA